MTDNNDIDSWIAGLKFPRFGSYVVGKMCKEFGYSNEEATLLWYAHLARRTPANNPGTDTEGGE
jgi:hypothetical protein